MTDEEFIALPYAEAMRHLRVQGTEEELNRLKALWEGAHGPIVQHSESAIIRSLVDTEPSSLEQIWNVLAALSAISVALIALLIMFDNGVVGVLALIGVPFAGLVPFSVAVLLGRVRRIEGHLASLASNNAREVGGS